MTDPKSPPSLPAEPRPRRRRRPAWASSPTPHAARQRRDQGRPGRLRRPGHRRRREHLRGGRHRPTTSRSTPWPTSSRTSLNSCRDRLKNNAKCQEKFDVADDRSSSGFDAYQKVIDCCDLVILATPPGFRPQHIEAAVKAGKHLFTEKPVAVDGTGIRKVMAAAEEAEDEEPGRRRRHPAPPPGPATSRRMKRIHDGAIGDIITGPGLLEPGEHLGPRPRSRAWSDMDYQLHNWYHFLWLCGDHIVEQHVHNLDVARWAIGDATRSRCVGMGGRQVNDGDRATARATTTSPSTTSSPNDVHVLSMCRQIAGCENNVSETIVGTKGQLHQPGGYRFSGANKAASGSERRSTPTSRSTSTCSTASPRASRSTS